LSTLLKINAIYIALVFIVPGYIFLSLRNKFVAGQERLGTEQVIPFVIYSALNFALFGWIVYFAISYQAPPYVQVGAWILTLVILPVVFGIVAGFGSQKECVARIYRSLGLNPVHSTPRAWEYVFFNSPPSWVFITLKNGTEFAGFWGGNSFASSDSKERDLFISEVFDFSGEGPWRPTGKSLFIGAGEIRTIEFTPINNGEKS